MYVNFLFIIRSFILYSIMRDAYILAQQKESVFLHDEVSSLLGFWHNVLCSSFI